MAQTDTAGGFKGPGRRSTATFQSLVSPLGEGAEETPVYSPSRPVTGATGQSRGRASQRDSARSQRRGE